jgi:fatty-acyl-CoA synthase
MDFHFATLWETVSDTVPDRVAVIQGDIRLTWREFDDQAARLATALEQAGVAHGGRVGLYLYNAPEYLVAQYGAFKHRCCPVNVNYRYLDDELTYLLDNCDAEVLFFHTSLGDRVGRVKDHLPNLKLLVEVDDGGDHLDGAVPFDQLLANHEPQARHGRAPDDLYMLYTGGTTGMPKGVMYDNAGLARHICNTLLLGGPPDLPTQVEEVPAFIARMDSIGHVVSVPCCPLMHGTGMWVGAMRALLSGGTVALLQSRNFNALELWELVERESVTEMAIVGDPFARPMVRALEERLADGNPYQLSSLRFIISSGAMWSSEVKAALTDHVDAQLIDALGSTEGGSYGQASATNGHQAQTARFELGPGTRIVTEDDRDVEAGSGEQGLLVTETAAYGYFKDEEKTARTFQRIDGKSYVITGDWATVDAAGIITLLGRGSNCINTGGEKVYPEEVEEAIKRHADVDDCLVVGLPDERFGQRVIAVASSHAAAPPSSDHLKTWLRTSLSGYKVPREILVVENVRRAPNGKADYGWARDTAAALTASTE